MEFPADPRVPSQIFSGCVAFHLLKQRTKLFYPGFRYMIAGQPSRQSLVLKLEDRLSHGSAAHFHLQRQQGFNQSLSRRKVAVNDGPRK